MLFNSIEFLIFLPIVFLLHWFVMNKSARRQNLMLIVASYLFYGWWNFRFLLLIFAVTAISYGIALYIDSHSNPRHRKLALGANVIVNLAVLGTFKYFDFFAQSFASILNGIGLHADAVTLNLILPVGISFYTFQAMGYVIDVYRGKIKAVKDITEYFVFISFFPQLVAGPIERAANLLPQFAVLRAFNYTAAVKGMQLILWGLFKKMVVADNAALIVDSVFDSYTTIGALNLWIGAILFSIQIYCDFSGYSDIAIGTARLFGITLMPNFNKPYFSRDIAEFWRRWHISLTTWFRDYIYIPLGGSRSKKPTTARNTLIIFLTSGLWHGANYTFIAWGGYHALLFLPLILTGKNRKYGKDNALRPGILPSFKDTLLMGYTFFLVMIGWIMFRANHIGEAVAYVKRMFADFVWSSQVMEPTIMGKRALTWAAIMIVAEWITRHKECPLDFSGKGISRFAAFRWSVYIVIFMACLIMAGTSEEFIYFKF